MTMMIQAPSANFAIAKTTATIAGRHGPDAVDRALRRQPGPRSAQPVADHARLRQRERREDADRVQRDQRLHPPAEGDHDDDREDAPARRCRR